MIHPTRTNLLRLREKLKLVINGINILKARKQALVREFLSTSVPFLKSREEIREMYGKAIRELLLSLGREGEDRIESIVLATEREFRIEVMEQSIWGLRYKDVIPHDTPVRDIGKRGYDESSTTLHLEEGTVLFEKLLESMLNIAAYESKLKRLADEITKTTRRIKVLEEVIQPDLKFRIRTITQYIGERDRESYYRLKKFKETGEHGRSLNASIPSGH